MKPRSISACMATLLCCCSTAFSATLHFTASDGDWNVDTNYSDVLVPLEGDSIYIGAPQIINFPLSAGATPQLNLLAMDREDSVAKVKITGGTLNVTTIRADGRKYFEFMLESGSVNVGTMPANGEANMQTFYMDMTAATMDVSANLYFGGQEGQGTPEDPYDNRPGTTVKLKVGATTNAITLGNNWANLAPAVAWEISGGNDPGLTTGTTITLFSGDNISLDDFTGTFTDNPGKSFSIYKDGTGVHLEVTGESTASAYDTWASINAPSSQPNADYDLDGVSNAVEFMLNGLATTNDIGKLPVVSQVGGNLVLEFTCLNVASRGGALLKLQYSKDLGITDLWTSHEVAVPDTAGIVGAVAFTIPTVNPNSNLVNLKATIPASEASPGSKLFARLMAQP